MNESERKNSIHLTDDGELDLQFVPISMGHVEVVQAQNRSVAELQKQQKKIMRSHISNLLDVNTKLQNGVFEQKGKRNSILVAKSPVDLEGSGEKGCLLVCDIGFCLLTGTSGKIVTYNIESCSFKLEGNNVVVTRYVHDKLWEQAAIFDDYGVLAKGRPVKNEFTESNGDLKILPLDQASLVINDLISKRLIEQAEERKRLEAKRMSLITNVESDLSALNISGLIPYQMTQKDSLFDRGRKLLSNISFKKKN